MGLGFSLGPFRRPLRRARNERCVAAPAFSMLALIAVRILRLNEGDRSHHAGRSRERLFPHARPADMIGTA